ncbi:hypothetical protein NDI47_25730 [Microcoleus vaginatus GB1-A2]|uniref:hypothetical protein n=1 Tax=Microcoleus vaginatus TaxID=119532 RepID=UPI0018F00F07
MLEDLLDLGRADSGKLQFRLHPVMLNTVVAEVAEMSEKVSNWKIIYVSTNEDVVACAHQDCLQQPFSMEELLARVKARLRLTQPN